MFHLFEVQLDLQIIKVDNLILFFKMAINHYFLFDYINDYLETFILMTKEHMNVVFFVNFFVYM